MPWTYGGRVVGFYGNDGADQCARRKLIESNEGDEIALARITIRALARNRRAIRERLSRWFGA